MLHTLQRKLNFFNINDYKNILEKYGILVYYVNIKIIFKFDFLMFLFLDDNMKYYFNYNFIFITFKELYILYFCI